MKIGILSKLTEEDLETPFPRGDSRLEYTNDTEDDTSDDLVLDSLASHIKDQFELNSDDRREIEQTMLDLLEAVNNKYDAKTLGEINKMGGSKLFMPLTSQQVSGAISWINSILDNGWDIEPTPIPELPESIRNEIMSSIQQTMAGPQMPKTPEGIPMGPQGGPMKPSEAEEIKSIETTEALDKIKAEAIKRASRMLDLIKDQLVDSNWSSVLKDFTSDLAVFPTAFIKTTYKPVKHLVTTKGPDGLTMEAEEKLIEVDERISPFDYYPSPDQTHMNNGSPVEVLKLSRKSLYDYIGVKGYSESKIREVLNNFDDNGLNSWQKAIDTQRRVAENHSTGFNEVEGQIIGLRFMGPVKASDLKEWAKGASEEFSWIEELDEDCDVEIEAILVGNEVIKAVPNLDPLGHRKVYSSSYKKVPGSIWGISPAMLVQPHQKLVNATCRALSNNMGMASGPMAYILIDRLPQGEELGAFHPWKQYQMTSDPQGANVPPIQFFQPNDNSQNLLNVYQYYMNEAYSITGIPRVALEGPTSRMGSGDHTSGGIASEIENASKQIRLAVSNIEKDVVIPRIKDQYHTNMIYHESDDVKGDFNIVAKGASASIAKAIENQQSIELLNALAGGPGAELVGMEGFATILGRIAKNNDMPTLIPDSEQIKAMQQQQQEQQAEPPPTPEQVKLQIEQIKAETRLKDQQLEDKNAEAERQVRLQIAQMELQMKQMDFEVKMQLAEMNKEQQKEVTALQGMNANARAKDANEVKLLAEQIKAQTQLAKANGNY